MSAVIFSAVLAYAVYAAKACVFKLLDLRTPAAAASEERIAKLEESLDQVRMTVDFIKTRQ